MSELVHDHAQPLSRGPQLRSRRRRALASVLLGAALAAGGAIAAGLPSGSPGAGDAPSLRLHFAGRAAAGSRIMFTLSLRLPGSRRLQAELRAIENPSSPRFQRSIGPRAFGKQFGLRAGALSRLRTEIRRDGLRVLGLVPQHTDLRVSGTVATVERLFATRIGLWTARGARYHAPLSAPRLPASLRSAVAGLTGLDTRPSWIAHDVPSGGLTPSVAATAYDIDALHQAGFEGQGENIAVISFSAFDARDPAAFARRYDLSGPPPRVISVDGGTRQLSGADEADLDIEVIRAIAPRAQILFYELPPTSSAYTDAIDRIVADDQARIVSSSWGECERELFPGQRASDTRALSAAVAAGISLFVSSGDSGAYDCQASNFSDHRRTVDWPASSGDAVAVGGTRLSLSPNGGYLGESAWEDQLSGAGGGGGFSVGDPRPSWQAGPGVQTSLSTGDRQLPDVSADADPGTPWAVYVKRQAGEVGGTSAAAPFWAASMLLIGQYAAAHGVPRLGFVDPVLYALAASPQRLPPFHDVTRGANRYYRASSGWDPATGLGSPDVANLAQDFVAYLRAHPG